MPFKPMFDVQRCQCCLSQDLERMKEPFVKCKHCGHLFTTQIAVQDYSSKRGRNIVNSYMDKKNAERIKFLSEVSFQSLIDIGCAEGTCAKALKDSLGLKRVDGVELSQDADVAAKNLDHVYSEDLLALIKKGLKYEVVSMFHVLEHIEDIRSFIKSCVDLSSSQLCIEVPLGSGNPMIEYDLNAEHLHFFSCASLTRLVESLGMRVTKIETGGYESPRYNDCIRMIAAKNPTPANLKDRILKSCGSRFAVYGLGGDFETMILPLGGIEQHFSYLSDKNESKASSFKNFINISELAGKSDKILVSSIQYGEEIKKDLLTKGISADRIISIASLLSD